LALSRRDYKISEQVLREEIEPIGFIIENVTSVGPIEHIGAMSIYTLRKS
jgi:predicted NUDIX family phosphoesterase